MRERGRLMRHRNEEGREEGKKRREGTADEGGREIGEARYRNEGQMEEREGRTRGREVRKIRKEKCKRDEGEREGVQRL